MIAGCMHAVATMHWPSHGILRYDSELIRAFLGVPFIRD